MFFQDVHTTELHFNQCCVKKKKKKRSFTSILAKPTLISQVAAVLLSLRMIEKERDPEEFTGMAK